MKRMKRLGLILIFLVSTLAACGIDQNSEKTADNQVSESVKSEQPAEEKSEQQITITLSKDHGNETIDKKNITIKKGDILMDVLKKNFKIKEDNGLITSIDGTSAKKGENKAWMYDVNGKMAEVGANEYKLAAGDEVVFDFRAWK